MCRNNIKTIYLKKHIQMHIVFQNEYIKTCLFTLDEMFFIVNSYEIIIRRYICKCNSLVLFVFNAYLMSIIRQNLYVERLSRDVMLLLTRSNWPCDAELYTLIVILLASAEGGRRLVLLAGLRKNNS